MKIFFMIFSTAEMHKALRREILEDYNYDVEVGGVGRHFWEKYKHYVLWLPFLV